MGIILSGMESVMTDNEIIKALECCNHKWGERVCSECEYATYGNNCGIELLESAYTLIKRQNAEIEALKNSKSEAIKEFAVRVKMEVNFILLYYKLDKIVPQLDYEFSAIIQKIEKEMTEGENG